MENKTGKYLKYAIGEIILVVIGILIALSINNWNENRKNSIKEIQFLKSFKVDLLANKEELKRVIEKTEITFNVSDSILKLQRGELKDFDSKTFISCMMNATGFTVYKTQEGTVQDILGSGSLDIIKNDSIRLAVGSWVANLKDIREWEKLDKTATDKYYEHLIQHVDIYKFEGEESLTLEDNTKEFLLKDRMFLNRIADRILPPRVLNNMYNDEINKLERLLNLIDSELENNQ
jgi:hypothetical protein